MSPQAFAEQARIRRKELARAVRRQRRPSEFHKSLRLVATMLCALASAGAALGFEVHEVAPGVFVHQGPHEEATVDNLGAFANHGFIVGDEAVAVIDVGGSLRGGERLRAAIEARTQLPVRYVIATHDHPDHSFGAGAFAGAELVGHARLASALDRRGRFLIERTRELLGVAAQGTEITLPSTTVAAGETLTLELGNRPLRLRAWPTAHTDNDLTVLDSSSGTLWAGDLLFVDRMPIVDGSLLGWLDVIDALRTIEAQRAVPGHGPASVPWPQALDPQVRYLVALRDAVRSDVAEGRQMLEVVQAASEQRSDEWQLFERYHARNVTAAYKELEWE